MMSSFDVKFLIIFLSGGFGLLGRLGMISLHLYEFFRHCYLPFPLCFRIPYLIIVASWCSGTLDGITYSIVMLLKSKFTNYDLPL